MVSAAERWRRYRAAPERWRAEGRAEGVAEGVAGQDAAWEAWLARKEAAEAAGEAFTEPNPADLARSGDA